MRGLGVAVLEEGAEFAPTGGTVDQRQFAAGDAPEAHPHRQRHHMQAVQNVVQGGRHCG
jgi:hypothetical protein